MDSDERDDLIARAFKGLSVPRSPDGPWVVMIGNTGMSADPATGGVGPMNDADGRLLVFDRYKAAWDEAETRNRGQSLFFWPEKWSWRLRLALWLIQRR
jgi:hypothetical protein